MDWMTGSILAIGIAILCVFVVIPTQEFAQILRRLRRKPDPANLDTPDDSVRSEDDRGQAR